MSAAFLCLLAGWSFIDGEMAVSLGFSVSLVLPLMGIWYFAQLQLELTDAGIVLHGLRTRSIELNKITELQLGYAGLTVKHSQGKPITISGAYRDGSTAAATLIRNLAKVKRLSQIELKGETHSILQAAQPGRKLHIGSGVPFPASLFELAFDKLHGEDS